MANTETDQEEKEYLLSPVDPLLQYVVSFVNNTGIGVPVMLTVKGMLITGNIIKRDEYYNKLIATLGNPANIINLGSEASTQIIAEHFSKILETFRDLSNKPDKSGEIPDPTLIHLENVHIINTATGRPIPLINALWRGHLDSIDGFVFGSPLSPLSRS